MKKIIALILAGLMATAAMTACTQKQEAEKPADSKVEEAVENADESKPEEEKVEEATEETVDESSFEYIYKKAMDVTAGMKNYGIGSVMELEMSAMGDTLNMETVISMEVDGDKMYVVTETDMGELGAETVESYIDMANSKQYVAIEDVWYSVALDASVAEAMEQSQSGAMDYMEYMSVENGTVEEKDYEGTPCYEIAGVIDLDFLDALEKMNLGSLIGDTEEMGLPENFFEEVFKDIEPFVMVMGVDKETYAPLYAYMDMTEMMDALMGSVMDYALEAAGEEITEEMSTTVDNCTMTYIYTDIGNVTVTLPENAQEIEM